MKKISKLVFFIVILLAINIVNTPKIYSKTIYPNVGLHPRVLINSDEIKNLKEKFYSEDFEKARNEILKNSTIYKNSNTEDNLIKSIEANAFLYLINNKNENGQNAIRILKQALSDTNKFNGSYSSSKLTFSLSLVYDWCYDLLSYNDKSQFISSIKNLTSKTELNYPLSYNSSITGHSSGDLLLKNLLSASIAVYDEDNTLYENIINDINKEFIPSRKFVYNSSTHHQGTNYGSARFDSELISSILLTKIGYKFPYSENQFDIPLGWLYHLRGDGRYLTDGDTFDGRYVSPLNYIITSGLTQNKYLAKAASEYNYFYIDEPILFALFYDSNINKSSYYKLPLTKYFNSPIGKMIARTGWDKGINSSSVVAEMKIGEYNFANHSHLDAGSFQIYYKGALAIDSGVYEGTNGGYNSEHYMNYYKRTIAHNSMLIYDPKEEFNYQGKTLENDGGQRFPNNGDEAFNFEQLKYDDYKTGKVLANWFGPSTIRPVFSYLKGDITSAYSDKATSYNRSFVFINNKNKKIPATMIVYDKVTSKTSDMKKTFLLHSIEKPSYSEDTITIKRSENDYKGKLTNTILLPESRNSSVEIVGGEGEEFLVNDKNYYNSSYEKTLDEGKYRIELSSNRLEKTTEFLNVMQMSNSSTKKLYDVEKTSIEDKFYRVEVSNKSVLLGKSYKEIDESFKIKNKTKKSRDYLVTDLKEGKWEIYTNDKILKTEDIDSDNPVLNFKTSSKNILIKKNVKITTFTQIISFIETLKTKYLSDLVKIKFF
jgi:heparin/heparan-sulfate lyase